MAEEADDERFQLTLSGSGISVTKSVDAATANAIINIVMGGHAPPASSQSRSKVEESKEPKVAQSNRDRVSLREFLDDTGAERYPDKILAIGQYMSEHEGSDTFSRDDIKGRFKTAQEASPGNFPRDFAVALKSGWIAEDPASPSSYYVTRRGSDIIASGFSADLRKITKPKRRKGAADKSTSSNDD